MTEKKEGWVGHSTVRMSQPKKTVSLGIQNGIFGTAGLWSCGSVVGTYVVYAQDGNYSQLLPSPSASNTGEKGLASGGDGGCVASKQAAHCWRFLRTAPVDSWRLTDKERKAHAKVPQANFVLTAYTGAVETELAQRSPLAHTNKGFYSFLRPPHRLDIILPSVSP